MLGFHTLNARDNSLIHWIFQNVAQSDPQKFRRAMQAEARTVRDLLASRTIRYDDLKSALIPTPDGQQVVFLYDWWEDDALNYAVAFAEKYLPHVRTSLRTSMLHGDLHDMRGPMPIDELEHHLVRAHEAVVNWQTQYGVYFSNLRRGDVTTLHAALQGEARYTGYLNVSHSGPLRDFVARTVAHEWIIVGRNILLTHGADQPFVADEDPVGFGLPRLGYQVVSLIDYYFTGFLSYKIEATDAYQAREDRILNLAAVTGELIDADTTEIIVPPDKLDRYLLRDANKLRLMTNIGLQDVSPEELSEIIRMKLVQSYVYDFRFAPDGTALFAVSGEFEKPGGGMARRLLALKHDAAHNAISLVSMY